MAYGEHMNKLEDICQQVWNTPELVHKRNLLRRAVKTFKYKKKTDYFMELIEKADEKACDILASNLALNKTDKVVGLLPR